MAGSLLDFLPMGIGGIVGGIANLFDDKAGHQQDLINQYIKYLQTAKTKRSKQSEEDILRLKRQNEATKYYGLSKANQLSAEEGKSSQGSVYASEMAGDTAMTDAISKEEIARDSDLAGIDDKIATMGLNSPYQESGVSKFLGGAISGAGTVGKFQTLFQDPLAKYKANKGSGDKPTTSTPGVNTPLPPTPVEKTDETAPGSVVPDDDKTSQALSSVLTGDKKKMKDRGNKLLRMYDPSSYSLMKNLNGNGNNDLVNYYASLYS
jgi:DNA-binding protein H-NS